jgi:enoyl-CoA hydratase/carnithine racemase
VPDHELFDTSLRWARKMAQQPPLAIQKIKQVSHQGELGEGLEVEAQAFGEVFASADAREGIGAFLGKRQPRFRGE